MNNLIQKAEKLGFKIPAITSVQINEAVLPVLRKMEQNGIKIDTVALKTLDQKLTIRVAELEKEIHALSGSDFNIGSPIQMADVLFNLLKLPTEGLKRTKSGVSTAAAELLKIADKHPVIVLILENREISKLISTYLRPLPLLVDESFRLHTTYSLDTSTGRLSSSEPNLQNIPIRGTYGEEIRATFIAEKGCKLIVADYSQIELRIVACLANDKSMIEAFDRGDDIHTQTAAVIFNTNLDQVTSNQRRVAKAVNFGIVYGQTAYGLSQALGIEISEASKYITNYFDRHTGIKNYINDMIKKAHTDGFVETIFGAKRYLPNINSSIRYIAEGEERMAINTPVQGTAAELLKLAMIEFDRKLTANIPAARMLLTVHDELVIEAPTDKAAAAAELLKDTMENIVTICIPIEVSIGTGDNWASAK